MRAEGVAPSMVILLVAQTALYFNNTNWVQNDAMQLLVQDCNYMTLFETQSSWCYCQPSLQRCKDRHDFFESWRCWYVVLPWALSRLAQSIRWMLMHVLAATSRNTQANWFIFICVISNMWSQPHPVRFGCCPVCTAQVGQTTEKHMFVISILLILNDEFVLSD